MEVRIGGEEELDGEECGCAANHVKGECAFAIAACDAGLQREDDGGANQEEEVGEDEVGESESIPGRVIELSVDVGPVAGIVDQDHEGDGEAAQDVDGEDAAEGGSHE